MIILDPMKNIINILRWLPAFAVMVVIFGFSSIPSQNIPSFGMLDLVIKKGAHILGYGLLALSYLYGLQFEKRRWWLAFLLAVLFAVTDEFHQSTVPGRHPSWVDAFVFDGGGAAIALGVDNWLRANKNFFKRNG